VKILLSPSKTMSAVGAPEGATTAPLLQIAEKLANRVGREVSDWSDWYGCSDAVAKKASEQWLNWAPNARGTKAAWTFTGEAFGRLKPNQWSNPKHAEKRLRILSGLYGILRPSDGILPYRLDVGQSLGGERIIHQWKIPINEWLQSDANGDPIVNCASEEYAELFERDQFQWIDCVFLQTTNGKTRSISALSKQARGAMARHLANHSSSNPEVAKTFNEEGYAFNKSESTDNRWVFVRRP
jgi:cytoplasmic iron level regulating protein YaaA (DUF328/UPF0246 family)